MLSVIIPSYKDPLLQKTIDSLLANAVGEIEIVVVLDGYWPSEFNWNDKRIKIVHLGKNRGMRGAINAGVLASTGDVIMRTDEHCMFAEGFDKVITDTIEDNWIVTPRRYFLDVEKWEVMPLPPIDFCKLGIRGNKFSAEVWAERDEEMKDVMIGETMGMQGSCWFMKRSWWDKVIGELQTEGYGPLYQDSHEMIFKTWKAGGKMMLNKNTWHAHKHRNFKRTHNNGTPENPSNNEACFKYSLDTWREYFENEIKSKWKL